MLITCAHVTNYKRIREVEIRPEADKHLLLLAGPNTAGKTSVMDAIALVIGGKKVIADDPVHHGADEAVIELEWDNGLMAKRTIDPDGTTKLEVRDKTQKLRSPQEVLDKLLGQRMLDPLAFIRLSGPERRAKLLELIDTEKQIPAMDERRQKIYDTRTETGRRLKDAEGELHRLPPEAEVAALLDVGELAAENAKLTEKQQAGHKLELEYQAAAGRVDHVKKAVAAATDIIAKLEAQIREARQQLADNEAMLKTAGAELSGATAKRDAAVTEWTTLLPRREQIAADLARANAHNRSVVEAEQSNARRAAAAKVVDERKQQYDAQTEAIAKVDAKKLAFLAAAKLPVPGLGIADGDVTFNDVPLSQASGAEKLRIALGISIASQSEIGDILIRDAALLDDDSLKMVDEVVTAAGCRCWLERVGTRDPGAIVIRDGAVVE